MKRNNIIKLTGLTAAMIFASTTWAEKMADFETLDQNQDGKLTADEVVRSAPLTTRWTEVDRDGNASIDREEFSAFEEMQRGQAQQMKSGSEGMAAQPSSMESDAAMQDDMAAKSQGMKKQGGRIDHPLYSMSPEEMEGQEILGSDDSTLGKISKVVSDRNSGRVHIVVSTGGFMGIAARKHAFPLDDLQMEAGVLRLPITEQELDARDQYYEDAYVEVEPEDRPISEFAAFEEESESADKSMGKESDKDRSSRYDD